MGARYEWPKNFRVLLCHQMTQAVFTTQYGASLIHASIALAFGMLARKDFCRFHG